MANYEIRISISEDALRGLSYVADALEQYFREGLGTGDAETDRQARAAAAWIVRARNRARLTGRHGATT